MSGSIPARESDAVSWTRVGAIVVATTAAAYLIAMHVLAPWVADGAAPLLSDFAAASGLDVAALSYIVEHLSFALAWGVALMATVFARRAASVPGPDADAAFWRGSILVFTAATVVVLLLNAAHGPAIVRGDGHEYFLTSISFANHGTPDLRDDDVIDYTRLRLEEGLAAPSPYDGYFRSPVDGRHYSWHFWLVPALASPIHATLDLAGLQPLKSFEILNTALLLAVMLSVALFASLSPRSRALLAALTLFSPLVWYVSWPSAEVFAGGMVVLSICAFTAKRPVAAVLFASLAATQNPALVLLVAALAGHASWSAIRVREWRTIPVLVAAGSVALLPMAFYLAFFGAPNLIQHSGMASLDFVTPGKIADFFLSLDQGLLPYVPIPLALGVLALIRAAVRRDWWALARVAIVMAAVVVTATTIEWNSDAIGLRRHAMWILPIIIWLVVDLASDSKRVTRAVPALMAAQMLVTAAWVFPPGMSQHTPLCEYALGHFTWIEPVPDVFAPRTLHLTEPLSLEVPVCFAPEHGITRVLTDKTHLSRLDDYLILSPAARRAIDGAEPASDGLYFVELPEGTATLRSQSEAIDPSSASIAFRIGGPSQYGRPFDRFNRLGRTDSGIPSAGLHATHPVYVTVTNAGETAWYPAGTMPIGVLVEVVGPDGETVTSSGPSPLPRAVLPGETFPVYAGLLTPSREGKYRVRTSLVQDRPDGGRSVVATADSRYPVQVSAAPVAP